MRLFIAFLLAMFVLGGTDLGRPFRTRPLLLLACCTVVGAMYYSYRVIR